MDVQLQWFFWFYFLHTFVFVLVLLSFDVFYPGKGSRVLHVVSTLLWFSNTNTGHVSCIFTRRWPVFSWLYRTLRDIWVSLMSGCFCGPAVQILCGWRRTDQVTGSLSSAKHRYNGVLGSPLLLLSLLMEDSGKEVFNKLCWEFIYPTGLFFS